MRRTSVLALASVAPLRCSAVLLIRLGRFSPRTGCSEVTSRLPELIAAPLSSWRSGPVAPLPLPQAPGLSQSRPALFAHSLTFAHSLVRPPLFQKSHVPPSAKPNTLPPITHGPPKGRSQAAPFISISPSA